MIKSEEPDPHDSYAPLPHMAPCPAEPVDHSLHVHDARDDIYFNTPAYHTPTVKRTRSAYSAVNMDGEGYSQTYEQPRAGTEIPDGMAMSDNSTVITADTMDDEIQSSKLSLKGQIWPGMDLFDSATPDGKRKRNQRKDGSILEQMKLTSESVTATESIWSQEGEFQRDRDIYASPSIEGSPVSSSHISLRGPFFFFTYDQFT